MTTKYKPGCLFVVATKNAYLSDEFSSSYEEDLLFGAPLLYLGHATKEEFDKYLVATNMKLGQINKILVKFLYRDEIIYLFEDEIDEILELKKTQR